MKTIIKYITLVTVSLFVSGCLESGKLEMPKGYVELDSSYSRFTQRATNADKCIIAVRIEDNLKNATLDFWKDTIVSNMANRGYELTKCEKIETASKRTGKLLKFKQQDMTYWLAIFLRGEKVYLLEAGGSKAKFKTQEKEILQAFKSLNI